MWKVVVTEIQDASAREPDVPPGAFFVSKERFSRTVENLDLALLINMIEAMQSSQEYGRELRRAASKRPPPKRGALRVNGAREMRKLRVARAQSTGLATQLHSKTTS
jgi:hypothetical protein